MQEKEFTTFTEKWGARTSELGWTAIPVALISLQSELKINAVEMNVLVNLLMHWWIAEKSPYPSQDSIAHRMGVSKRTVQRAIDNLVKLKLINVSSTSRVNPVFRGRNLYDLSPLVDTLDNMSVQLKNSYRVIDN
jgi:predicted transcriptional regulator